MTKTELCAADQVLRLVRVMQRADPAFCALHGLNQVSDEEWDDALADAEDWLADLVEFNTGELR